MEQRTNFKFCFKIRNNAIETFLIFKKIYDSSHTLIFNGFRGDGQEYLNGGTHLGRPKKIHTPEIIEKLHQNIVKDANVSIRLLA